MRKYLVIFLLAFLLLPGAAQSSSERIVGGWTATRADWRFMVALASREEPDPLRGHFCGGVVVRPRVVLTAAHCLQGLGAGRVRVLSGSASLRWARGTRGLDKSNYPRWRGGYDHDIALLSLRRPIPRSPLVLRGEGRGWLRIAGWGALEWGGESQLLHKTVVSREDDSFCSELYGYLFDAQTMLCAGGRGRNICYGDSGGPIFQRSKGRVWVYGISSWGDINCRRKPSVFAKPDPRWVWEKSARMAEASRKAERR